MNNCEVLNAFGTYELESQFYGVLSLASRLAANAKNRANTVKIAYGLFTMDRDLSNFLNNVHAMMEGKKAVPPASEPITRERMIATAENLEHLYRVIDYIHEAARRARLTNNSLTAGSLNSLKHNSEELLDFAHWVELLMEPQQVKTIFDRAAQEKESGEIYDLSQV